MQSLILIIGFLVLGLISLIFLYVFLKIIIPQSNLYGLQSDLSEEEIKQITKDSKFPSDLKYDIPSFKIGFNQGMFVVQMGLYKLWLDGGESMVIGTFDNLKNEIDQNLTYFFSESNNLKIWNEKFIKYLETQKAPPK